MSIAATARPTYALPSGFEQLYADNYDFVWRCALRLGAAPEDAEDIVQETFVVALRRYEQTHFEAGGARPSTWLFAILHNVLRNHARGERRRRARLEAVEQRESLHARHGAGAEGTLGLRLLDEFLRELDPDRRAVFVLAELEGMRGPEIATALGLNPNTVRSRLRAARHAFEARFEREREPLVEAAANERAPSEVRARGLALLAISLELQPTSASATASGWTSWLTSARGLLAVTCGAAVVVGAGLLVSDRDPAIETTPRAASVLEARPSIAAAPQLADAEPPEPEAEPAIVIELDAKKPSVAPRAEPASLDTAAALDRLDHARQALLAGDAEAALALVQSDIAWPPALDAHRIALEVGTLCNLDQPERARARAEAWLAAHPSSRSAVQLRAVCWSDDNTSPSAGHQAPNEEQQ